MDNSTNGTQSICSSIADSEGMKCLKTVAYSLVIIAAVLANVLILLVVYNTKNLRSTINYFVANMAVSDLLLAASVYPRLITEVFWGPKRWLVGGSFGSVLCKLDYLSTDISLAVSIQSLVLIAVDRFYAVVFPLHLPLFSTKLSRIVILCTWLVATALHFPYLLAFGLQDSPDGVLCWNDWNGAFGASSSLRDYYVSLFVFLALIPFCLMIALYSAIVLTLKHRTIPGEQSGDSRETQIKLRRERSVLAMAIATVVGFALCWAPMNVYAFLKFFALIPSLGCSSRSFYFAAFFLAYSNCTINPCLCFAFSKNYRLALKSMSSNWWCKFNHRRVQPEQPNIRQPGEIMLADLEGRNHFRIPPAGDVS